MASNRRFVAEDVKCDLYSRFSLADKDLVVRGNCKKLFDRLRNAHWYYLDFYCPQPGYERPVQDKLSGMPIAFVDFCGEMIEFIPEWKHLHIKWRNLYDEWRQQTSKSVRCGAIVLDSTYSYVLLVRGFFRDGYQFPAGKKDNDGEPYETCAIREVSEETGLDLSKLIRPSLFFERKVLNCIRRYYIVTGVSPDETTLCPSSRNEIKVILWMKVDNIPEDNESARRMGHVPRDFFLCMPWARQLKIFSRHLREGALLFQALQLSEVVSDDTGDTTDEQQETYDSKGKLERNSKHQKKCDKPLPVSRSAKCPSPFTDEDNGETRPPNNKSTPTSVKCNASAILPQNVDKVRAKRRCERRRYRITNISSSNFYSDSQIDDGSMFSRVINKASARKKGHNKVKDSSILKMPSSVSCSDSGYSDQSDQTSSSFGDHKREKESSSDGSDSLMNKAIIALKHISLPSK